MEQRHRVTSIGKLHYVDSDAPQWFRRRILPLHIVNASAICSDSSRRIAGAPPARKNSVEAGPANPNTHYDRDIAARLTMAHAEAPKCAKRGCFISASCPLSADRTAQFYDMPDKDLPWPLM
jgi:hypothetical protein